MTSKTVKMTRKEQEALLERVLQKHGYNDYAIAEIKRMTFTDKPSPPPKPVPEVE